MPLGGYSRRSVAIETFICQAVSWCAGLWLLC